VIDLLRKADDLYSIEKVSAKVGKEYIRANHYSHGSHNGPSPCYGLFQGEELIGVCMFATPCSEAVRASLWGPEHKNRVTELHRLHIKDGTPQNTESWFVSRCLKLLREDKPRIRGVLSFSDLTEGHTGVIYQATNAFFLGHTGKAWFYRDEDGRLRHPRQCGVNISKEAAVAKGWTPERREAKCRYLWILANGKIERRKLMRQCKYDLGD